MGGLARDILRPAMVFIFVAAIVTLLIVGIGNTLLHLHPEEILNEFTRPDLLFALGLALLVLFGCAFLALPRGGERPLDHQVAIGSKPMFAEAARPEVDLAAPRRGAPGTWADIQPGFTLYARNGPLARVEAVLPAEEEYGRTRRGLLYASGMYGANDEMWIPVEAVYAVFPETASAFLAAKGDEIEHFGWNLPPQSFRRGQAIHQPISSF
jgi:hypothetical protein